MDFEFGRFDCWMAFERDVSLLFVLRFRGSFVVLFLPSQFNTVDWNCWLEQRSVAIVSRNERDEK